MTIQNIEDVMDRIMNLNRNLTEESLRTLLSASGWDKEDIMEGIHIFRSTRGSVEPAQPIQNFSTTNNVDTNLKNNNNNNDYTFNIAQTKPEIKNTESVSFEKEINHDIEIPKPDINLDSNIKTNTEYQENIDNINRVEKDINISTEKINTDIKDYSLDNYLYSTSSPTSTILEDHPKNDHNLLKILSLILGLLLLTLLALYFYFKNPFTFNKYNLNNSQENIIQDAKIDYSDLDREINTNIASTTTQDTNSNNSNNSNIDNLTKEIERLKLDLETYKNMVKPTTQTIVKYISQKGPRGATGSSGRGILAVDATTTGFIIRYTDNTSSLVPYSATTVLGVLDSQAVCFRDASSTGYMINDVCLDKVKVLNLLNK